MSAGADPGGGVPAEWGRLETAAQEAASVLARWSRRAREMEEEVERLRQTIADLSDTRGVEELAAEVKRLQEENAAMKRRMVKARKQISGLMQRLSTLEVES